MIIVKMQYFELGKYIKNKREYSGWTLNKFAFECDIDPAILCRIENQKQNIKLNVLEKIAKGFGKTPAELLTEFEANKI